MKKVIKRSRYDKVRAIAVEKTAEHFGITQAYVRQIDNGGYDQPEIKKWYRKKYEQIKKAVD